LGCAKAVTLKRVNATTASFQFIKRLPGVILNSGTEFALWKRSPTQACGHRL